MVIFPPFAMDAGRRQIFAADGTPLHLTPKAFDLLRVLIEAAPHVLRKAELHTRLWPDTFVSDAALTSIVKELRRALGDRDRMAPLIKTCHGIGYSFAGPLTDSRDRPAAGVHWLVGSRHRFSLKPGINTIGRGADSDVWLDAAGVSRLHARVIITGESAAIEDLGSKNGTVVGAAVVRDCVPLQDGDCIRAGGVALMYRRQLAIGSTDTIVVAALESQHQGARLGLSAGNK